MGQAGIWFLPISGDFRVGGHYQVEGIAGGEIIRCFRTVWESLLDALDTEVRRGRRARRSRAN